MPDIATLDFGPQFPEHPIFEQIRKLIGSFAFQQTMNLNPPIDVAVVDYISGFAATSAIANAALTANNTPRTTSTEWAKSWIVGFIEWYRNPANAGFRNDSARQPDFWQTCLRGALLRARADYSNIPWTPALINRTNGPWQCQASDDSLARINRNLQGCTIVQWKGAKLRDGLGPNIYLPNVCTYAGVTLELGDELFSDWVAPVDDSHGHPCSAMFAAYGERNAIMSTSRAGPNGRIAYDVIRGGTRWRIVVITNKNPPCVITFFRL